MSADTIDPQLEPSQEKRKTNFWKKYFGWICLITAEPSMCLYYLATKMNSVVEEAFYLDKSCRVDHGFSEEICNNLTANVTITAQVQVTVSTFIQWNSITGYTFPIILSIFFGGWSDRRGRKAPLVIALVGKAIESGMLVVNSLMDKWNLNTILYTATLPMAMLGSDVVIYACCFSYIADVSSSEQRTRRMIIMATAYLTCSPVGIALGSYLYYNVVNSSYTAMFAIQGVLFVLAVLYSTLRLEMRTTPNQMPMEKGTNLLVDFFDKQHVVECVKTLTKPRSDHRRLCLWILLLSVALFGVHKSAGSMTYLYTQLKFSWNVATYSQWKTFQSSIQIVVMLFGVSTMNKLLGMRDSLIIVCTALSAALGKLTLAVAEIPELFYVAAVVSILGPIVGPVLKSMSSKVVPAVERGKVLVLVCVFDKAMPLISAPAYSQLYNATLTTTPSAILWLTFATLISLLPLMMVIRLVLGSRKLDEIPDEDGADVRSPETLSKIQPAGPEVEAAVRS